MHDVGLIYIPKNTMNCELQRPYSHIKSTLTFQRESHSSSIARNSTIASNKQWQEHNDTTTIQRGEIKGVDESSKESLICKNLEPKCKP